jgi:hypothetical protein
MMMKVALEQTMMKKIRKRRKMNRMFLNGLAD